MRNEGVRDATSISESKSTTASNAQQDSMFRATIRTVFPLWLDLDKNLVLAHDLHHLSDVAAGFMEQL